MLKQEVNTQRASVTPEPIKLSQIAQNPLGGQRLRIGILGGTFNPPHLGHLLMAEQVGNQLELDEVWFMPTAKPPHKPGTQGVASQHRLKMLELAIEDNPLFKIQPYEINRGGVNYTVDTMRHFIEEYPEVDFYFIIGGDSARDLKDWKEPEVLVEMVQIVAVKRPGANAQDVNYPIIWVDSPMIDISSSEVRLRVYLDQSIRYQVPDSVRRYIYEHNLYAFDGVGSDE